MSAIEIRRWVEIDAGHRVFGHEGKCARLHGHRYRIEFVLTAAQLDPLGRVTDFAVVKERLCVWLEERWDHRLLLWTQDPLLMQLHDLGVVAEPVAFNPTAENMAQYLLDTAALRLSDTAIRVSSCTVHETAKCSATAWGPR